MGCSNSTVEVKGTNKVSTNVKDKLSDTHEIRPSSIIEPQFFDLAI